MRGESKKKQIRERCWPFIILVPHAAREIMRQWYSSSVSGFL